MDDPLELALYGVGLPVAATVAAALLFARILPERLRGVRAALALAIGFVASWLALEGMPPLPPRLAHDWLTLVAVIAVLATLGEALLPRVPALVLPAVGCAAGLWCVGWPPGWSVAERVAPSAALLAIALLHRWQVARIPEPERAWLLPALSGATAASLAASGTLTVAHAAGALACGQVALLLVSLVRPAWSAPGEATTLAALLLLGHWQVGAWFNELPYSVLVLIAAAPAAYLLPGTPRRLFGRSTRTWLAVLVLATAVGISLWFRFATRSSGY